MPQGLKVLISAYACEPGKGSEPEVGWQWALQMARFHDVTVLTRTNNQPAIERALAELQGKQPLPQFVYHDRGPQMLALKKRFNAIKVYYLLWQRSAREMVQVLHEAHQYDLMHHVTFAAFRYPVAIWGHGVPSIWGPVGGIESIPHRLLPWHHLGSLAHEMTRNTHNLLQATPFHVLPRRARATTLILASTREMQSAFARLGFKADLMPTIGLRLSEWVRPPHPPSEGPLKLLFVGNIITLKGIDLALEALKDSGINATFSLVGTGNYLDAARQQAAALGLQSRVTFLGRLAREQVLKLYGQYDLFVFPSLHDTGGYAVIEAMACELPVVCLDCGGPAVAVRENCGLRVPLGRREQVVAGLAAAFRRYDQDRALLAAHGREARAVVSRCYDWERKGEQMNECYLAARNLASDSEGGGRLPGYTGMGGLTNVLHQMFSLKGLALAGLGLLLIGALGFLSISRLKRDAQEIVEDTLPGLSYAGEANASLAQAFNRSLLLVMSDSPEERAQLRSEIDVYSQNTTNFLSQYRRQIFAPDDEYMFDRLLQRRAEYVAVRERVFNLSEQGDRAKALAACRAELLPAYQHYKEAGDRLFEYNMRQGHSRGHSIMRVSTLTQCLVAAIGILVFIAGFLFGMFK